MEVICCICHEDARIPVKFTCFPCDEKPGKPSCNAVLRACLLCAREYLDLNSEQSLRAFERKCLLCPATYSPRSMDAQFALEKDFLWMNLDPKKYPCCYSAEGCAFVGLQNDLDRHLQTECDFRIEFCPDCHQPYPFRNKDWHTSICSARTRCPICSEAILWTDIHSHLILQHGFLYCKDCKDLVNISNIDDHRKSCPCRKIKCPHCSRKIDCKRYWGHLRHHFDEILKDISFLSKEIQNKNDQMNSLLEEILEIEKDPTLHSG